MANLLMPKLSYQISGICFKVHNKLGRFCKEKQYADELENLLREYKIEYKREIKLEKLIPKATLRNIVDFIIENKIIMDLKAKKFITKEDYYQMQRYLKAANIELGLIINFRKTYLKPKRVLNHTMIPKQDSEH